MLKSETSKIIQDCNLYQALSHFTVSAGRKPELRQWLHLFKTQSFSREITFPILFLSSKLLDEVTARVRYPQPPQPSDYDIRV